MLIINAVDPEGTGAKLGLVPGDAVLAVNGRLIRDIVDYYFQIAEEYVEVTIAKETGSQVVLAIPKAYEDSLGLGFDITPRACANKCLFCFVDQQPPGLRKSLYIKDDDYRFSFLYGNYVTLTNLRKNELERIATERLSPLYVSVHATDPRVRGKLLGRKGGSDILSLMKHLSRRGVDFHCQVVLCPGFNDGVVLEKTIADLSGLGENLLSLAVVPVGLTRHRQGLHLLRPVDKELARQAIGVVDRFQAKLLAAISRRTVYAADELFLRAELPVPGAEYYEQYSQLENGVGMIRRSLEQLEHMSELEPIAVRPRRVALVTGHAARRVLERVAAVVEQKLPGLDLLIAAVDNTFFGSEVTVAGLLTGRDVVHALTKLEHPWQAAVLPEACVRAGQFIDGLSLEQVERKVGRPLLVADDPRDLVEKLKRGVENR